MNQLEKLQAKIPSSTAFLLSNPEDIRYFSQFEVLVPSEREALLIITKKSATLLHANFSPVNNQEKITSVPGCYPEKLRAQLLKISSREKLSKVQIDKNTLFVAEYDAISNIEDLAIEPLDRKLIWELRAVKDKDELSLIRKACEISSKAIANLQDIIEEGISELEVERLLEDMIRDLGSEGPAFPTIVAFGEHSALPHHQPTSLTLKENMPVLIDFGASYQGYCSDMTRTFWFGPAPQEKYLEIEALVHKAYKAAMVKLETLGSAEKPLKAKDVDWAARSIISDEGYGQNFTHTTGHGLGLAIHEQPSLSWVNTDPLSLQMTITIEPGIYLEGLYGYRYENTVLLGKKIEELTW